MSILSGMEHDGRGLARDNLELSFSGFGTILAAAKTFCNCCRGFTKI
jgi:hypothetical protein